MRLSISNIAWAKEDDEAVYQLLVKHGYDAIDIAPSRIWSDIYNVSEAEAKKFLDDVRARGLSVTGMQSLLFQRPDLTVFDSEEKRTETSDALKKMLTLGAQLGAKGIVFGSPKNRIMGEVTPEKWKIAEDFFRTLGNDAHAKGVYFCIEPNPTIYGGDFLTHTKETFDFVERINSPGLKVNLDMGTVIENKEDVTDLIVTKLHLIGHTHVSMPHLKPIEVNDVHRVIMRTLQDSGYEGTVAIEMGRIEGGDHLEKIDQILGHVKDLTN